MTMDSSTYPDGQNSGAEASEGIAGVAPGMLLDGRYRIVRLLGAGGMGAVYEARNERIDRAFAVKFLRTDMAREGQLVARFLQEARTASQVHHSNIVEVFDSGREGELVWLVMELLVGESLQSLIAREGPLDPERVRTIIDPVCAALAYVHALGVIHRDVKPDNVFLARVPGVSEPSPKLLDFGIARSIGDGALRLTATGAMLGTPAYMSPEQCVGKRELTAAADQYALGATIYEMLCGSLPHEAHSYNELVCKRATEDAIPLANVRPGLPLPWCELVMRAIERRPEARYPSIEALRAAMWAIPVAPLRDDSRLAVAVAATAVSGEVPKVVAAVERPLPARRWPMAPWAVAVLLAGTLGVWRATSDRVVLKINSGNQQVSGLESTTEPAVTHVVALTPNPDPYVDVVVASGGEDASGRLAPAATPDAGRTMATPSRPHEGRQRPPHQRIDRAFPGPF